MLSYRHSFHAGNFADVLKHIVLMQLLEYMTRKDKAFDYIDSHAGAGRYRLDSAHAQKTAEWQGGVGKLFSAGGEIIVAHPVIRAYCERIMQMNSSGRLLFYPGSPEIAASFLREGDRAWLYELHPADFALLDKQYARQRQVRVRQEDGLKALPGLLPCASRRAVVLIDPSYEIKQDYPAVVEVIGRVLKKMANTVIALWYPVVDRDVVTRLEKKLLQNSGGYLQVELGVRADSKTHGMTAAGLFIINAPWTLQQTLSELLPELANLLGEAGEGYFRLHQAAA